MNYALYFGGMHLQERLQPRLFPAISRLKSLLQKKRDLFCHSRLTRTLVTAHTK